MKAFLPVANSVLHGRIAMYKYGSGQGQAQSKNLSVINIRRGFCIFRQKMYVLSMEYCFFTRFCFKNISIKHKNFLFSIDFSENMWYTEHI